MRLNWICLNFLNPQYAEMSEEEVRRDINVKRKLRSFHDKLHDERLLNLDERFYMEKSPHDDECEDIKIKMGNRVSDHDCLVCHLYEERFTQENDPLDQLKRADDLLDQFMQDNGK